VEPAIEQLDSQIKQTDTVKSLHDRDDEIVKDLEDLKDGQTKLNDKVDIGFEKGRKRMDGLEDKVETLTKMMIDRDKKSDEQHNAVLNKITDNEMVRMGKMIEDRDKAIEKKDSRLWEIGKIVLTATGSIVATAYLFSLGIK